MCVSEDVEIIEQATIKYSISDNLPVLAKLNMKNNICNHKFTEIKYRNFKKCDYESFREDLENAIWPNVKLINVNEALKSFTSTFTLIIDKHFPKL